MFILLPFSQGAAISPVNLVTFYDKLVFRFSFAELKIYFIFILINKSPLSVLVNIPEKYKFLLLLFLEEIIPGIIHQPQGQEATALGMLFDLTKEDYMTSTHRSAGHWLTIGVTVDSMIADMFAKKNGCCKLTDDYFEGAGKVMNS